MKVLYNEGRVQGLSSYELYVRQMLSRNPEAHILSESQWLAASLSTNNSMVLKITAGTTEGYHDYILPEGSDLCGCTTVFAALFEGSATFEGIWAKRIDDYGRLISNTPTRFPVTPGEPSDVPAKEDLRMTPEYIQQCSEFMKVSAGLVLQPGEWIDNVYQVELLDEGGVTIITEEGEELLADLSDDITRMSLDVDLSARGFVRLLFTKPIEHDFYIFLHGFAYKNVLAGMSGFDNLLTTSNPENGDFLGPQSFPWAVPIFLLYTGNMLNSLQQTAEDMVELYNQVIHDTEYFYAIAERLNNYYTELVLKYNTLMQNFARVTEQVATLEAHVSSFDETIENIQTSITETNGRIDLVNEHDAIQDTRIDSIDNSIRSLNNKYQVVHDLANDIARRVDNLKVYVDEQIAEVNTAIETTNTGLTDLDTKVGKLEELQTDTKTNIVYAINEVNSKV